MVFSLLGHLIIVEYSVFKYLRFTLELEEIQGPPGSQLQISSKEVRKKTYLFWMKTYLIWKVRGGGLVRGLTKKTYPVLFLQSRGPLGRLMGSGENICQGMELWFGAEGTKTNEVC